MSCPYCKSRKISEPKCVLAHGARELAKMGIPVPHICQCETCTATFSVTVMLDKTRWEKQAAMAVR